VSEEEPAQESPKEKPAQESSNSTSEESPYGSPQRLKVAALTMALLYFGGVLLIVVSAPTLPIPDFPSECPEDSQNCSRIADNPYRANGENGLFIDATEAEVLEVVNEWVGEEPRTVSRADGSEDGLVHAVFRSLMWRFPDDLLVQVHCLEGQVWIQIHSESRIGVSDLNVNDKRVLALDSHLDSTTWSGAECV
jgi:uncharacterized protein (DUF1499 family)